LCITTGSRVCGRSVPVHLSTHTRFLLVTFLSQTRFAVPHWHYAVGTGYTGTHTFTVYTGCGLCIVPGFASRGSFMVGFRRFTRFLPRLRSRAFADYTFTTTRIPHLPVAHTFRCRFLFGCHTFSFLTLRLPRYVRTFAHLVHVQHTSHTWFAVRHVLVRFTRSTHLVAAATRFGLPRTSWTRTISPRGWVTRFFFFHRHTFTWLPGCLHTAHTRFAGYTVLVFLCRRYRSVYLTSRCHVYGLVVPVHVYTPFVALLHTLLLPHGCCVPGLCPTVHTVTVTLDFGFRTFTLFYAHVALTVWITSHRRRTRTFSPFVTWFSGSRAFAVRAHSVYITLSTRFTLPVYALRLPRFACSHVCVLTFAQTLGLHHTYLTLPVFHFHTVILRLLVSVCMVGSFSLHHAVHSSFWFFTFCPFRSVCVALWVRLHAFLTVRLTFSSHAAPCLVCHTISTLRWFRFTHGCTHLSHGSSSRTPPHTAFGSLCTHSPQFSRYTVPLLIFT